MSESDNLPRVMIRKSKNGSSISVNFASAMEGLTGEQKSFQELIDLLNDWTSYCIASMQFVPIMAHSGFFMLEVTLDEGVLKFLSSVCISKEEIVDPVTGDETFSFILHEDDLHRVLKKMDTTTQMTRAADAVKRSTLGGLIAEFEFFIVRFLEIVSRMLPEKFYDQNEKVTLGEIVANGSVQSVVQTRISATISKRTYDSNADVLNWIFETFELTKNAKDHRNEKIFKEFLEVCLRRNILVHNGGIVNRTYEDGCKEAGLDLGLLPKLGERAEVDLQYIRRATARVYLTGYYMLHLFLSKHHPKMEQDRFLNMLSTSHTFLENDLTKMCSRICDFAEFSEKKFDHDLRLKFGINRALSYLFDPNKSEEEQTAAAAKVLDKYDWSVTTPVFNLALACIRRDFSNLLSLADAAQASGLDYNDARTFVVFREARKIEGFLVRFPRSALMIGNDLSFETEDEK